MCFAAGLPLVMAAQSLLNVLENFGPFGTRLPFPEKYESLSADAALNF
jgi:hypothetical protein